MKIKISNRWEVTGSGRNFRASCTLSATLHSRRAAAWQLIIWLLTSSIGPWCTLQPCLSSKLSGTNEQLVYYFLVRDHATSGFNRSLASALPLSVHWRHSISTPTLKCGHSPQTRIGLPARLYSGEIHGTHVFFDVSSAPARPSPQRRSYDGTAS